jgi:hypothetical protein
MSPKKLPRLLPPIKTHQSVSILLPVDLHAKLKARAAREHRPLYSLCVQLLLQGVRR